MHMRTLSYYLLVALFVAQSAVLSAQAYTDEKLVEVWEQLTPSERSEVAEWFRSETEALDTSQNALILYVANQIEIDHGYWPTAGPKPFFNPGGKRQRLAPESPEAQALKTALSLEVDPRLWSYDFGTRRLIRHGELRDSERVFRDAVKGRSPGLDFTLAELSRRLDSGAFLNENAALSRAYSNSEGQVFSEVSLFDYLAANDEHVLTETDARAVLFYVNDQLDSAESVELLSLDEVNHRVHEIFEQVRVSREIVETYAAVYLLPKPDLAAHFGDVLELHALWLSADSNPDLLRDRLPSPDKLDAFLTSWRETFRLKRLRTQAIYRQRNLTGTDYGLRALFERVLEQFGAFEPRTPAAEVQPVPEVAEVSEPAIELDGEALENLLEKVGELRGRERKTLMAECREAALSSGAPQVELVRLWSGRASIPLEELDSRTVFDAHDAKIFGGGPKRRQIGPGDRLWDAFDRKIVRDHVAERHWRVDYEPATRKLVKLSAERDKTTELRLLLRGELPDEDLARAVILSQLKSSGVLLAETEFFAHSYSDRDGNAYQGMSLAEVWSSSVELEVPDVDALAYIQKVWNDATVRPPLDGADHAKWYPRMGESLERVRHRQQLSRSLVAIWFDGRPKLRDGYDASIDIMHALVAKSGENAARVAEGMDLNERLYLERGLKEIVGMGEDGWNAGNERRDALIEGRVRIRQAVLRVLLSKAWIGE